MGKTGGAVWGVGEHQKLRFGHVKFEMFIEIPVEMLNWLPYLTWSDSAELPRPPYKISSSGCIMLILVVLIFRL